MHTVASVGFLFTLNYDARNRELKNKMKRHPDYMNTHLSSWYVMLFVDSSLTHDTKYCFIFLISRLRCIEIVKLRLRSVRIRLLLQIRSDDLMRNEMCVGGDMYQPM